MIRGPPAVSTQIQYTIAVYLHAPHVPRVDQASSQDLAPHHEHLLSSRSPTKPKTAQNGLLPTALLRTARCSTRLRQCFRPLTLHPRMIEPARRQSSRTRHPAIAG